LSFSAKGAVSCLAWGIAQGNRVGIAGKPEGAAHDFKCIDLPTLIRIKEAAGRPKDREALAELRVLLEEQKRMRR